MSHSCPNCRDSGFTVLNHDFHTTETFRPYLHTDPRLSLLCNRCGWVGLLAWLNHFNRRIS